MTRVCHVTCAHARYDERIFLKECASLAKAGYEVVYLVPDDGKAEEIQNGVRILPVEEAPQASYRMRFLKYNKIIINKALEIDADIYHLHEPELLRWVPEFKRYNKSVIFDCHERFAVILKSTKSIFRKIILYLIYLVYQKSMIKKVDRIIVVTSSIINEILRINPKAKITVITNYPIVKDIQTDTDLKYEKPALVFAGGISEVWNHEIVLQAIDKLDVEYILMGPITNSYLKKLQHYQSWNKVKFLGQIPHEQVIDIMRHCFVGICIASPSYNSWGKLGTMGNNKFFEQMQAGLPVICTDFVLWKEIIDKWKCGICVDPSNIEAVTVTIQYLLCNADKARIMGDNGRRAVTEEFNWKIEEKKLLKLYKELCI